MHLASINSADEQRDLQEHIQAYGNIYFNWNCLGYLNKSRRFYLLPFNSFYFYIPCVVVGMGHEHFWTSGTDQGEEGKFFWMANGKPVTFENWNAGEANNFV